MVHAIVEHVEMCCMALMGFCTGWCSLLKSAGLTSPTHTHISNKLMIIARELIIHSTTPTIPHNVSCFSPILVKWYNRVQLRRQQR